MLPGLTCDGSEAGSEVRSGAGLIATYHSKSIRRSGFDVERAGVYDPDEPRAVAFANASGHSVCFPLSVQVLASRLA